MTRLISSALMLVAAWQLALQYAQGADSTPPSIRGFPCTLQRTLLNGNYYFYWCSSDIYLKVLIQANTTGWIGIGFAPTADATMLGADFALGYVNGATGAVVLQDCIGTQSGGQPDLDTTHGGKNDLINVAGWEQDGWTSIQFDRLLTPTDTVNDRAIDMTRIFHILVAYGASDDLSLSHRSSTVGTAMISPYSSLTTYGLAPNGEYRSINGSGNNIANPTWGQAGDHYVWKTQNYYADNISAPAGPSRPPARIISNQLLDREDAVQTVDVSILLIHFGQLLAHDISYTTWSNDFWPIYIPKCDPVFDVNCANTHGSNMTFFRTAYVAGTGTNASNPRLQINGQTAFIDGSVIYGQTNARARALRAMVDGKMLLDQIGLLPDLPSVFMEHEAQCPCRMRSAGDQRANVHSVLFAMHTIFVREHNRWCDLLKATNPDWNDETLYQEARRRVIALFQKIALYLPAVLGKPPVLWTQYDPTVVPRLLHEFNVCAFRYGHSELQNHLFRYDKANHAAHLILAENLFNGHDGLLDHMVESMIRGAVRQRPGKSDLRFATGVRSFLFGNPRGTTNNGTDLPARSIQRGRDHGIADYVTTRLAYGLSAPTSWNDVSTDEDDITHLNQLFPNMSDVDLYIGGLAEDKPGSALVGPLYAAILEDNFNKLRDGDRFWFENGQFSDDELSEILATRFSDVLRRNTNLTSADIPDSVFYLDKRYTDPAVVRDFPTKDGYPDPAMANFTNPVRYDNELVVMDGTYKLLWSADDEAVNFMLQVKTIGWVGIGFEPRQHGMMIGADIVIARFINGALDINDYKAVLNVGKPKLDTNLGGQDDVEDAQGVIINGWSIVRFRRKRVTKDTAITATDAGAVDHILYGDRDVLTIFAFQQETPEFQYHGHNVHTQPILFRAAQEERETHVTYPVALHVLSIVLCCVGIVITLFLAVFQWRHRTKSTIRLSSPAINNIMFVGALLAYASIPYFTMDSTQVCTADATVIVNVTTYIGDPLRSPIQPCHNGMSVCLRRLWLLSLGFTLVFSSMFSKTYRVHRILVRSATTLKRVTIKNKDLYPIIGALAIVDCVVLLCWTLIDPFVLMRQFTGMQTTTTQFLTRFVIDECVASSDTFWGLMFGYKTVLLGLAAYTATATRNIVIPDMRDFSSVGMAIYSITMVCFVVLPALYLLKNDVTVRAILAIGSIFFCTTTTLLILFAPKVHDVYFGTGGQRSTITAVAPSAKSNTSRAPSPPPTTVGPSRIESQATKSRFTRTSVS